MITCKCPGENPGGYRGSPACANTLGIELPRAPGVPWVDIVAGAVKVEDGFIKPEGSIRIRVTLDNIDTLVHDLMSYRAILVERMQRRE